jgi:hypothetical protein
MAVVGQVEQVVQHIDAGRAQPEDEESEDAPQHQIEVADLMRGEQRREDQQVLHPLVKAQRLGPGEQRVAAGVDHLLDVALPFGQPHHRLRGIDHPGLARMLPDRQIDRRVAHVVEALVAVIGDQALGLAAGREVPSSVPSTRSKICRCSAMRRA